MRDDHCFPDVDTEAQGAEWLGLLMRNALGKSNLGGFSGGCWPGGLSHGASGSGDDQPAPGPGPSDCWRSPLAWYSLIPALLFLHLQVSLGFLGSGKT